jgi:uncharacterized membrane protein YraQ (UPF0718 family)
MQALYIAAVVALLVSFVADRGKTGKAIKVTIKKLRRILPGYLHLLILLSFVLLVSDSVIIKVLSVANPWIGLGTGLAIGSITMMPGFISYPLAGVLVEHGVRTMVVAGFVTSLMMVGVVTFPVEKAYFGTRLALMRNGVALVIALVISIAMGFAFGEWA